MMPFSYVRPARVAEAVAVVSADPAAKFVAGGTDLLNLIKDGAEQLHHVVDINRLPLAGIGVLSGRTIRIGALTRMREAADHPVVRTQLPVLSQALLASASPQVRNMAAIGGNLLQRTRCGYFRDTGMPCNKREPGSGCPAQNGQNRIHAIFGGSQHCIAVHPSDFAVALRALDATVLTTGPAGDRRISLDEFYVLPGTTPHIETTLRHGELITAVEVPLTPMAARSRYVKLRDRASFEFAVVSIGAALDLRGRRVRDARLAFGGVGTRPWRSAEAEEALRGRDLTSATIAAAADAAVRGAVPRQHNQFKIELLRRALTGLLTEFGG
ncbi:FAD binding domain-containing protein [Kibdelosporangium aridum]|uniref:Xanthine dehydrogenase YagS FAD-binding subunit n=1 Tax=Kibdelosporangium aridum TaxID=2030 RepID=A0A1Y5Y539_KIBAR|nr:xanthine dehydrogenase family protein subunit M [Kibdelosporangium aridum]SMD25670.1 xanthine dehydrogenase YagS FAD-binding subunit [Kibdelosporangium aridum]